MSWSIFSTVTSFASKIIETVEETTRDFEREQETFIKQKASYEREDQPEPEAVPPWVGLHEEEYLKEQILELSTEKRNFLMDPPPGTEFVFDLIVYLPVAKAIMAHDERLERLRYELVPKQTKEYNFWRNYFYRVSLIKQSSQLNVLSQHAEARTPKDEKEKEKDKTSGTSSPSMLNSAPPVKGQNQQDNHSGQTNDSDFISDSMPHTSDDGWMKGGKDEFDQLGEVEEGNHEPEEYDWEKELAKELNDFETKKQESDWESEIKEILDD